MTATADRRRRRRPRPRRVTPTCCGCCVGDGTAATTAGAADDPLLLETNVDDLDPRVWPAVIAALLDAGASDAWLTPILMKKGRPAHTLSVLVAADRAVAVRATVFRQTSTIGLREQAARQARPRPHHGRGRGRRAADRGQARPPRTATVVNAQPEYDDVARAAAALGRPVADVLADAIAAARRLLEELR